MNKINKAVYTLKKKNNKKLCLAIEGNEVCIIIKNSLFLRNLNIFIADPKPYLFSLGSPKPASFAGQSIHDKGVQSIQWGKSQSVQ